MKPISIVNAAPNAEREAREGLELQLVSRKDSVSRSGRAPSAPHNSTLLGQSTEGKRGARPYVAGLEVARPNEAAYSVRAPRNIWLTPTLTADEIAAEGDRWVSSLQSVAIIYVFLFVLGWIGWNAHTISAWLYTHAQGIVGALFGLHDMR